MEIRFPCSRRPFFQKAARYMQKIPTDTIDARNTNVPMIMVIATATRKGKTARAASFAMREFFLPAVL